MANVKSQFELIDNIGSTKHYNGTVGTTAIAIPTVAAQEISEFYLENPINNTPVTKTLSYSCDGGVTYTDLNVSGSMIWTPKGKIKQLYIKGNVAAVSYKLVMNFEDI
jgi:hypothetical protein